MLRLLGNILTIEKLMLLDTCNAGAFTNDSLREASATQLRGMSDVMAIKLLGISANFEYPVSPSRQGAIQTDVESSLIPS